MVKKNKNGARAFKSRESGPKDPSNLSVAFINEGLGFDQLQLKSAREDASKVIEACYEMIRSAAAIREPLLHPAVANSSFKSDIAALAKRVGTDLKKMAADVHTLKARVDAIDAVTGGAPEDVFASYSEIGMEGNKWILNFNELVLPLLGDITILLNKAIEEFAATNSKTEG